MRVTSSLLTLSLGAALLTGGTAMAMDMNHDAADHGAMQMESAPVDGQQIHTSMVEGYRVVYRLIDMHARAAAMAGQAAMPAEMKSHHLMVLVQDAAQQPVTDARVGYLVSGPDGVAQKAMAMAMNGGYGADVDLQAKGSYTVKTKIMAGDKALLDTFTYTVD